MKRLLLILLLSAFLYPSDDWAVIVITRIDHCTSIWGYQEWTLGKVIKSSQRNLKGTTLKISKILGDIEDTVKVYRVPNTNTWRLLEERYK
jgi:hypothetical protein